MDKDRYHPLTTSRERNPLRPYVPLAPSPSQPAYAARSTAPRAGTPVSLSSTARDLLPDLDLDVKTSAGEAWQKVRSLTDTLLYRYTSVLLAQPFDVAKTILQVAILPSSTQGTRQKNSSRRTRSGRQPDRDAEGVRRGRYADSDSEESAEDETGDETDEGDDIPDYFSSNTAPRSRSLRKRRRRPPSEELSPTLTDSKLNLKRADSITHAISALYDTSGAMGLWRATNTSFLYNALLRTTDSFIRSVLLALLGLPEMIGPDQSGLGSAFGVPGSMGFSGLDLSHSPNPIGSLVVVGLSSSLAALFLAPLDLVQTRLILTPTSQPPRGLVQNLRLLPSALAPGSLCLPTVLAHSVPQIFSAACPLVLRRQFKISPETSPSLWSLAAFCTCLTDLFLRLPLETVVRRAHVSHLQNTEPDIPLVVQPAPYAGIAGTLYSILYVEGETRTKDPRTGMIKVKKGQGASGLIRGWRVGFWGLVGVWGAGALGPGEAKGRGEF